MFQTLFQITLFRISTNSSLLSLRFHTQVGDDYLEYLSELDKKLKFVREDKIAQVRVGSGRGCGGACLLGKLPSWTKP